MDKKNEIEQDKRLLNSLGSYSSIARKLGKSPQCVFNWSKRGIPAAIKLKHPDLFLKKQKKSLRLKLSKLKKQKTNQPSNLIRKKLHWLI